MSQKHKSWSWLKPRRLVAPLPLMSLLSVLVFRRDLRRNTAGKLGAENVGYGLAVGGAILALAALVGIIFVPVATFPLIDAEFAAFLGATLLVAGIFVHAAD